MIISIMEPLWWELIYLRSLFQYLNHRYTIDSQSLFLSKWIRFPQNKIHHYKIVNVDILVPFTEFCVLEYSIKRFNIIHIRQFSIRSRPVHRF